MEGIKEKIEKTGMTPKEFVIDFNNFCGDNVLSSRTKLYQICSGSKRPSKALKVLFKFYFIKNNL